MTASLRWKVDHRTFAAAHVRKAASEGLADAAEFLLEEANRTVPIEEATLTRSGATDVDGLQASVFYDTPYAVRQHEDTRLRHDQGRRAKWLEMTMREQAKQVGEHIADRIRSAVR